MSKRGGTSEVNGFISIGADNKSTRKKKDDTVIKRERDETIRKRPDPNQEPTLRRTRISNASIKQETSSKTSSERKEIKSKVTVGKSETNLKTKLDNNRSVKKALSSSSTSNNGINSYLPRDKIKIASKGSERSILEGSTKRKETALSPYISSNTTKPKTAQGTPILKKSLSVTNQSKDSPYKSFVAQKTQSHASGDRLRKTSQLKENPSKTKPSSSTTPSKITSKKVDPGLTRRKNSSASTLSTSKTNHSNGHKKVVSNKAEEFDSDSQHETRPFGEIPRSNTFTKEGGEPEKLMSDESTSQHQAEIRDAVRSLSHEDLDDNEYQYEQDFEDYESDFEEYLVSEDNSSTSKGEDDSSHFSDSTSSNSGSESLDEDEMGDGYRGGLTKVLETNQNSSPLKSALKQDITSINSNDSRNQQSTTIKDNLLNVEEERKLDSGSYDLASQSDLKRRKQIQDIRAAINKENASLSAKGRQRVRTVADDEGFVETFNQEITATFTDASYFPTERLINFENARKQQVTQKAKAKVERRGRLLMDMIKLDIISFNLLDIPSVPYEVYMHCYGQSNTLQIHTQTNEDVVSEEVQTEDISTTTKWTQHPVTYSSSKSPEDLLYTFAQEKLGVGSVETGDNEDWLPKWHVNSLKLHNFISNAGEMILTLLEEEERDKKIKVTNNTKRDFGFSDSFFNLNVQKVGFLRNRPVSMVCFSESDGSHILTVHKSSNEQPMTIQAESEGRCVLCTWSVREPSCPLHTLVASNNVTSVCYHSFLVLAGLIDGALCLWDLREQSAWHARCYLKEPEWLLRSPTYITADLEKGNRHTSPVVSIKILPECNLDDSAVATTEKTPKQVVSLDEDGLLAVWTIVESKSVVNINSGLAPWGRLRIVQSSQLRALKPEQGGVQCRCLAVDNLKPSNLYIGTNTGHVVHILQNSCRARPQSYSSLSGVNTSITCIEFSRGGYPLFMVGDSAGRVRMYRTLTDRPLLDLSTSEVSPGLAVTSLQLSTAQPGLFFALDSKSCIHVWNLCSSDICPQMSVPFKQDNITCISLSPHWNTKLLAVASVVGTVNVYNLKDEFGALPKKSSDEQHNVFSRYISIL